jgi:2-phospho-L-lactate/phosphoenolpyruvate guanylyltransferase
MWALIPMKSLDRAKSRLAPVLDRAERRALAAAMLQDVLERTLQCPDVAGVAVITADSAVARMLRQWPVRLIIERTSGGHSPAVRYACARLGAAGADSVLVISADVPTIRENELTQLVRAAARSPAVVIAADRHGAGSNGLVLSPPDAIVPHFGPDSLRRHCEAAARSGLTATTLQLPGIALDIDEPADLAMLWEHRTCRSSTFLHAAGIPERLRTSAGERP